MRLLELFDGNKELLDKLETFDERLRLLELFDGNKEFMDEFDERVRLLVLLDIWLDPKEILNWLEAMAEFSLFNNFDSRETWKTEIITNNMKVSFNFIGNLFIL